MPSTSFTTPYYRNSMYQQSYYHTWWGTGVPIVSGTTPSVKLYDDIKNGWKEPNWRALRRLGQDVTFPYRRHVVKENRPAKLVARELVDWGSYRTESSCRLYVYPLIRPPTFFSDPAVRDQALVRLKRKLANHTKQVRALTPLAELKDLRSLILGLCRLAIDVVLFLGSIRKAKVRDAHKIASDAWLSFSFGVNPMISDINAIGQSLAEFFARDDHSVRLTGAASSSSDYMIDDLYGHGGATWCCQPVVTNQVTQKISYLYVAGFNIRIGTGNDYSFLNHLGLEAEALPEVGWELIPFSWVVDYFSNVGEFLFDLCYTPPGDTSYISLNTRYERTENFRVVLGPATTYPHTVIYRTVDACDPGFINYTEFSREPITSLPHAGVHFKNFDSVGIHAVNKLLNLVALLRPK